jgi:hypothetical protein
LAAECGQLEIFKFFYKIGLFVKKRDAVHCREVCVKENCLSILEFMREKNIVSYDNKEELLAIAIKYGHIRLVKYFDQILNLDEEFEELLKCAISRDKIEIVEYFLNKKQNMKSVHWYNIAYLCCTYKNLPILKLFHRSGIDVKSYCSHQFAQIVTVTDIRCLEYLVSLGCEPKYGQLLTLTNSISRSSTMFNFILSRQFHTIEELKMVLSCADAYTQKLKIFTAIQVLQYVPKHLRYEFIDQYQSANSTLPLFHKKLKIENSFRKHNSWKLMLKKILNPMSLHMQLNFV